MADYKAKLEQRMDEMVEIADGVNDGESFALFSGGYDSLVAVHVAMSYGLTDGVIHLDTGTGIPENQQFVEDVCERYGWPLRIEGPEMTLEEFAKEWGFPGVGTHSWIYRWVKEKPLIRVAKEMEGEPAYWTGVRSHESERRMAEVEGLVGEHDKWKWLSPIHDFTDDDIDAYIEDHDLPRNPVVETIHRSGECYCGAFAYRDEELIELQAHYPEHYEWLKKLEREVQEEIGADEKYCYWGHDGISEGQLKNLKAARDAEDADTDLMLCRDCEREVMSDAMEW